MSQERCIFCSILHEKTNIIYENSTLFVIADKFPLSHGHLLVIPKKHAPYLHELADEDTKDILCVIKKLVNALQLKKYNILQNNEHMQSVKHVHFHIIPCHDDENQLKIDWKTQNVSDDYSDKMFEEVRKALGN